MLEDHQVERRLSELENTRSNWAKIQQKSLILRNNEQAASDEEHDRLDV